MKEEIEPIKKFKVYAWGNWINGTVNKNGDVTIDGKIIKINESIPVNDEAKDWDDFRAGAYMNWKKRQPIPVKESKELKTEVKEARNAALSEAIEKIKKETIEPYQDVKAWTGNEIIEILEGLKIK